MPRPSDVIAQRYRIERPLGAGSFAETFLAQDLDLGRNVAIKLLRPEHAATEETRDRFRLEAQTAASITHPNVVLVYDAGISEDTAWLVMEWIDGSTLKHEIRSRHRLELTHAVRLIDELLAGLSAIHASGIVHRDVKPQNVLVSPDSKVKITDFGVARTARDAHPSRKNLAIGTAAYMAPEQALGEDVTSAADIYAVGAILFEMLTGRLPFPGHDPMAVIADHVQTEPPRPRRINPNIPRGIEHIILTALAKSPGDRYQTAADMRAALAAEMLEFTQRRKGALPPAGRPRAGDYARPHLTWIAAAAVLVFVLLTGTIVLATREFSTTTASTPFESVSSDAIESETNGVSDIVEEPDEFDDTALVPFPTREPDPTPVPLERPRATATPEPDPTPEPEPTEPPAPPPPAQQAPAPDVAQTAPQPEPAEPEDADEADDVEREEPEEIEEEQPVDEDANAEEDEEENGPSEQPPPDQASNNPSVTYAIGVSPNRNPGNSFTREPSDSSRAQSGDDPDEEISEEPSEASDSEQEDSDDSPSVTYRPNIGGVR